MHSLLKYSLLWPSLHREETEAYTACGRQTPLILPVKAKTRVISPNNMEGIISLVEVFFYYYFILYLGRWKFKDFSSSFLLINRAQQRLQRTLTAPSMAACMAPLLVLEPPFWRGQIHPRQTKKWAAGCFGAAAWWHLIFAPRSLVCTPFLWRGVLSRLRKGSRNPAWPQLLYPDLMLGLFQVVQVTSHSIPIFQHSLFLFVLKQGKET